MIPEGMCGWIPRYTPGSMIKSELKQVINRGILKNVRSTHRFPSTFDIVIRRRDKLKVEFRPNRRRRLGIEININTYVRDSPLQT